MSRKRTVAILYNHVGEDEYEQLRQVESSELQFKPEYELESIATVADEIAAMVKALRKERFHCYAVNIEDNFKTLLSVLQKRRPDVIFNLIEFFNDNPWQESMVAGLFEILRVPYTGAPPLGLALCQRKGLTKQVLQANGIRTPRFKLMTRDHIPRRHGLHYPLIVKPAREDASTGIENASVVFEREQLEQRIEHVLDQYQQPVLVEEFIDGRELNVAVLGNDPPQALPISEIDFSELPKGMHPIVSYQAKWDPLHEAFHRTYPVCPAELPKRIEKRAKNIAVKAYKIMGCRDYARVDMRLSKDGEHLYVLEVNPNPDLTEGVAFMESSEAAGLTFGQTLRNIVEFALQRAPRG